LLDTFHHTTRDWIPEFIIQEAKALRMSRPSNIVDEKKEDEEEVSTAPTGYNPNLFVNKNDIDRLICEICHGVARNPVNLPCSHLFCRDCLVRHRELDPNHKCAKCRILLKDVDLQHMNSFVMQQIYDLKVKCPHPECNWIDILGTDNRNYDNHIKQECQYEIIECRFCKEKIIRGQLSIHNESNTQTHLNLLYDNIEKLKRGEYELEIKKLKMELAIQNIEM